MEEGEIIPHTHTHTPSIPYKFTDAFSHSPEGHANLTTPVGGFADDGLASLFGVKTPQKSRNSDKGHALQAEIVAPVCGVAALLAFGGLVWWWWIKRRAGRNRATEETIYYEKSEEPDVPREQVIQQ